MIDQKNKEIEFSNDARVRVQQGINILADSVGATLGPKGKNALIQLSKGPLVTKDGVTVAKYVKLQDQMQNIGADLVKQVSKKTNESAGDGTTTATVLAQAMINEGMKMLASGVDAQAIRRGMEATTAQLIHRLDELATPVKDLEKVATISANDPEIGKIISDMMEKVGEHGVITMDKSQTTEIETEFAEGVNYDTGFMSPYLVTDRGTMTAEYEDIPVILTDEKLNLKQTVRLLEIILKANADNKMPKKLLIVADHLDDEVLRILGVNKIQGNIDVLAVRAPYYGRLRKEYLEDLAVLTGGQFVGSEGMASLDDVDLQHLGMVKRVIAKERQTTIIGSAKNKEAIEARTEELKKRISECTKKHDRTKLEERLSKMTGGIGVIKVGANTEADQREKMDRVEDAINATRAASEEGIVAGGGVALIRATQGITVQDLTEEEKHGMNVVLKATEAPIRRIAKNAGEDDGLITANIKQAEGNAGYNAKTNEYVDDMITEGIVDPVKVTKSALENAVSIAIMVLTTEVCIVEEQTEDKE
jgi:chaperonin GroEL